MTHIDLRDKPNPYFPLSARIDPNDFVGRERETDKLHQILQEYGKSLNLRNIVISGERSIGKSCLANRYRQILEGFNFAVYETELPRDPSIELDEFEFFKELFDELFLKYAPPENHFFDVRQSEIWFSLTRDRYEHSSDFKERRLAFASQYANRKKGFVEKLSVKQLLKDFEMVLGELLSEKMGIDGLALIVDEFQELSRNALILDLLRQIAEGTVGLIIIGSGLPTFIDNPVFEKFCRTGETIALRNMSRNEVSDLIFRPLEKLGGVSRHEAKEWFDGNSLMMILHRGSGNPLHVKILCAKMFENYQNDLSAQKIQLNRSVMEKVNEYYATISDKSRRIASSLQSCRKDQLTSFALLYKYEGLSIRMAILLEVAFEPLNAKEESFAKDRVLRCFNDIWGLGLFEMVGQEYTFDDLAGMDLNRLSNVQYKFIGDTIDRLYAAYFFEGLTQSDLPHNEGRPFEDLLAVKLVEEVDHYLLGRDIPTPPFNIQIPSENVFIRINTADELVKGGPEDVIEDLDKLVKLTVDANASKIQRESVVELSKRHDLSIPAYIAFLLQLEGYFIVICDVTIRGKRKIVYRYFPVIAKLDELHKFRERVNDILIDAVILDQYMIRLDFVYVYWFPAEPLIAINYEDVTEQGRRLNEAVGKREFEEAVEIANYMSALLTKINFGDREIMRHAYAQNNYAFCLINIKNLKKAKVELEQIHDRLLISKLNLAYVLYLMGDFAGARKIWSGVVRKMLGKQEKANYMHLAVNEDALPFANRIIEGISLYNVSAWNLALLNAQQKVDSSRIYAILKKADPGGDEAFVDKRVRNWVAYYRGEGSKAVRDAELLYRQCGKIPYLRNDVQKDIQIFQSSLPMQSGTL